MGKQAAKSVRLLKTKKVAHAKAPSTDIKPSRSKPVNTGPLVFGAPVGNLPGPDLNPLQVIYDQNVMPKPNGLDITFTTSKGSIPVVTLWKVVSGKPEIDMVPANQVAVQWGLGAGIQFDHAFAFDNLEQSTYYWFRIHAGNDEMRVQIGPNTPAEYVDTAGTLRRDVTFTFYHLEVYETGGSGSGDLTGFNLALYNGGDAAGELLPNTTKSLSDDSTDNGDIFNAPFGGSVTYAHAPKTTTVYVMGAGATDLAWPWGGGDVYMSPPPDTMPSSPTHLQGDGFAYCDCWNAFTLEDDIGQYYSTAWYLGTGLGACDYRLEGRTEVDVSDETGALKLWPRQTIPIQLVPPGILPLTFGGMPHRIVIGNSPTALRIVAFRLSPLGEVYIGTGRIDNPTWRSLGAGGTELLMGASMALDTITLLARHQDGSLSAGYLSDLTNGTVSWNALGLKTTTTQTATTPKLVRRRDGHIAVFALDESGHLQHGDLSDGQLTDGWKKHGGPFTGEIAATEDDDGHLTVAARDAKGDVWHRDLRDSHKWHHDEAPIQSLLSVREGRHEKMTIYGIDKKRRVHEHVIGKKGWKKIGTPEEIVAAMQRGKRKH